MEYRRLFVPNTIVFITIVTNNRIPILVQNIDKLEQSVNETKRFFKFEIIAYAVLKDHIHLLIKPKEITDYPKIVKSIKYNFTVGMAMPTYYKLWQNRYFEHTIRDEEDLFRHLDYIHYNPVKHYNISPNAWKFSSFKDFVNKEYYDENWCNSADKHHINTLNYE